MVLVADRFLRERDSWFDIATADRVALLVHRPGPRRAQIAWAERCAMLVRLRHPLLSPLIDFGAADESSLFEAYAIRAPLALTSAAASGLVMHASRFLAAHGVRMSASTADVMVRTLRRADQTGRGRPLGLVLQPRRAHDTIAGLFSACLPGGATAVTIRGRPGSGLRTFATMAAHLARVEGYVPVSARALHRWPYLAEDLVCRHVCLFTDPETTTIDRIAASKLMADLGARSTRAHLCLAFERSDRQSDRVVHLDSMGMTSMTSMIYIDPDYGPSSADLFDAARRAEGLPGRFLAELGARPFEPSTSRFYTVHESTAAYGPAHAPAIVETRTPDSVRGSRIGSVLWRAGSRASTLEARGRHAAAARLLTRAARVLAGRAETAKAAEYWLQLSWIARNRGAGTQAIEHAERAKQTDGRADVQITAGCVIAACWTDESRLIEAEAALRALVVSADVSNAAAGDRCRLALARVLYWQGRSTESAALAAALIQSTDPDLACEARLISGRALLALGDVPAALHAARDASKRASEIGDARLRAGASRVMAEALCAAGDLDGVRAHVGIGLAIASAAHLPLVRLRLRAILLRALTLDESRVETIRLRSALSRALGRPLPDLLRRQIEAACANRSGTDACRYGRIVVDPPHLETFLDVAQRQKDDSAAVSEVAAAVCARAGAASAMVVAASDGRTIAAAGRPWRERSNAAVQALASGRTVGLDDRQPPEAAEPVCCGGELIAAIALRWIVGAIVVPSTVSATLRAASMAMATHVRAVLDLGHDEPPAGVWGDLLGESAVAMSLRESVQRASKAPFPVLIEGESGSGKELVARAIHKLSPRHVRRFCAINCAALSDDLIEAELFGHTRGAFTGATAERTGLFEEADGGTLFLDEVGELSARAQAKLLRVLQEGEVRRVGENLPRRVDVRIVAATNRRLEQETASGRFRTDLRFRLDVLRIVVPALRERVGDVAILAQHFWRQACARVGSQATLGPDALAALSRYDWPGNVRELQNAIAWIAVHAPRRGRVSASMLPAQMASHPLGTGTFEAAREEFERRYVRAALAQAGGHRQAAAKALGVSRQGLSKMLKRLGIDEDAR